MQTLLLGPSLHKQGSFALSNPLSLRQRSSSALRKFVKRNCSALQEPVLLPADLPLKVEQPAEEAFQQDENQNLADTASWFSEFWTKYNELLDSHPIAVKSATSFFGFLIGDLCAQAIVGADYDAIRTVRMVLFGVLMDGPIGHVWYSSIDKYVMPDNPTSSKAVVIKTILDQFAWAPFFTCVFIAFIDLLRGRPTMILASIRSKLGKTLIANYALWPLAHLINFKFVPPKQRILYINAVQICWTSYLSYLLCSKLH